jgi:hypothetical protein
MSENNVRYNLPESDLSYEQAVQVLKELEQSGVLRVLYPSLEPLCNSSFSVQIVGTLKFDQLRGKVVIQEGGPTESHIEFQFTHDLAFQYVDWLWGHPYIGRSLTIFGSDGFSLEIDEIVNKDEHQGEVTAESTIREMFIEIGHAKEPRQ